MNTVTLNTKGLQAFKRKLKGAEVARVQVGIFSDHDARRETVLTNAEIGAKHEAGVIEEGIPRRSFLEVPARTELPKVVEGESATLIKAFIEDGAKAMLERVGFLGEAVVQDAFNTGGFGEWPPNTDYTLARKQGDKPLIDTKQLRESISSRVV